MRKVLVTGDPISPSDVVDVAYRRAEVEMGPDVAQRMAPARQVVEDAIGSGEVIYGVTTGFGGLASTRISREQAEEVQYNLLRSHASGVGPPVSDIVVRAMLLLRARTLAQGYSGVRPAIVEKLVEMLERDVLPVVPSQGSVGASGDLTPFAHLALPAIGEGAVSVNGEVLTPVEAGLDPVELKTKEGLSLLNGTEGMAAMGAVALDRSRGLVRAANVAVAMTVEAILGSAAPFRPEIHRLRPHPGQIAAAEEIAELLEGSEIVESHRHDFDHAVQDAYSLRCAPQVHGAVTETLDHLESVLVREMGSVVDNPIVLHETGEVVSGGNFHGQPLAFSFDYATIGVAELASISERRTDRILDPARSQGLSPFLATSPGVDSGLMITQYVQAALVAENRVLANPASIDSIPTSGSQEDHVSMGWGAGKKLLDVIGNVRRVIAIEMLCAAQGIDERAPLTPGIGTGAALQTIRDVVPPLDGDRTLSEDIETIATLIDDGVFDT